MEQLSWGDIVIRVASEDDYILLSQYLEEQDRRYAKAMELLEQAHGLLLELLARPATK